MELLQSLASGSSVDIKEKDLTPLLSKVLRLKHEISETPFGQLLPSLASLSDLVASSKRLVRPYKDYLKTARRGHLAKCREPLEKLVPWLAHRNRLVGIDMQLVHAKAQFFHLHESSVEEALAVFNGIAEWPSVLILKERIGILHFHCRLFFEIRGAC